VTKEEFNNLLKVYTLDIVRRMTDPNAENPLQPTLPIAITRDEGGYLSHEIVNPLDPRVDDWRFFEDDAEIDWDLRRIVDDDTGKEAWSVCRVLC
jgi:hypothetical protein